MVTNRLLAYGCVVWIVLAGGCARYRYALEREPELLPQVEVQASAVRATRGEVTLDLTIRNNGPGSLAIDPARCLIITDRGETLSPRPPYEPVYVSRGFGGGVFYGYATENLLFSPGVSYWRETPRASGYLQAGEIPPGTFRRGKLAFYWGGAPEVFRLVCAGISPLEHVPELTFRRIGK